MTQSHIAELTDRGVLRLTGGDARDFLQNIITNDVALLDSQPSIFAALLATQGKILFDFFVFHTPDGYLLDMSRKSTSEVLARRLSLYKLRSAVEIENVSDRARVFAEWSDGLRNGDSNGDSGDTDTNVSRTATDGWFTDPRLAALGKRCIVVDGDAPHAANANVTDEAAYHDHRIALGVPNKRHDYPGGDTFPHDALLDQLAGVSFTKGCYVGQEVVSRMQHRGSARKRIVPVVASSGNLQTGADVMAGAANIGTVLSTNAASDRALALIRLDRAHEARDAATPLTADGTTIDIRIPTWATFSLDNVSGKTRS